MKTKASEGKVEEEKNVCLACGGALNGLGECTICGKKWDNNRTNESNKESVIREFAEISGVGDAKAELLYSNGYKNLDELRKAKLDKLANVEGIGEKLAKTIRIEAKKLLKRKGKSKDKDSLTQWFKGSDDSLAVWLGGKGVVEEKEPMAVKPAGKRRKDDSHKSALRRWLAGEEGTLKTWLTEVEADKIPRAEKEHILRDKELSEALKGKDDEIEALRLEMEELKKTLKLDLKHLTKEGLDPAKLMEDSAKTKADLQSEISKRRAMEEEIKQVKKGSIAIIKYMKAQQLTKERGTIKKITGKEAVIKRKLEAELKARDDLLTVLKSKLGDELKKAPPSEKKLKEMDIKLAERESTLKAREEELNVLEEKMKEGEFVERAGADEDLHSKFQAELAEREKNFLEKENELKGKIIELEKDLQKTKIEYKQKVESVELREKSAPEIERTLESKERELQVKEKSLTLREEEIQRLKDELRFKEDELSKIKEPLTYKEDELLRREEDLLYREKRINLEKRKLEEAKAKGGSMDEVELKERLETLKQEISRKEEEVRNKEKYLRAKMEELRLREQGLIEDEIEQREEERKLEITQEKIKTGTPRLDDLLLGGFPFGSTVAVYGPPFVGKEVLMNAFMAEGVKKGIPVIWVITDKMAADIREEMEFILPSYEEYEKLGLIKYVDSYSKSMGMEEVEDDPYTTYIEDPTDHNGILKAVDKLAKELKEKHEYYRLAFRSVSTLIAYLDPTTTYKFLQPFGGRRKRDKAVTLYSIEKGMHSDQEIQMIGSLMDGMIEFKVDQLKTLLSIRGVCDVQSRGWVRYTHSKHNLSVGSFSLEAIR